MKNFSTIRKNEREIIINVHRSSGKVLVILCKILMKLEISRWNIEKHAKTISFLKIGRVGAELFHAGGRAHGRTDMTKLIVTFPKFANAPTNATSITVHVADVYVSCNAKYK